ncbi:MAG: hypothetical protein JW963_11565 [Anaerolineales bacterium]|nr:hypothetical protein [Anaerolineales bacterium]
MITKSFKKITPSLLIVSSLMLTICACIGSGSSVTPSTSKTQSPTAIPQTLTVNTELSFEQIESQYDSLSDNDFDAYIDRLKGTRIHWIGKVSGGDEDTLYLDIGQKSFRSVYLKGISTEDVPRNLYLEFEATIDDFNRFLGFSLYLTDPNIIQKLTNKPTNTPIPSKTLVPTDTSTATLEPTPTYTASPTATSTSLPLATFTLDQSANIRSGPGTEYKVVSGGVSGDILPVYGKNADGSWLLIDPANYYWVFSSLGTLDQTIDMIPLVPTPVPSLTPTITLSPTPTPSRTPVPTATLVPTRTPIPPILLETIYDNYNSMTELQFNKYTSEIIGRTVRQSVVVGNVDDKGRVIVSGPWSPWIFNFTDFCVIVSGVPYDVGIVISGGEEVMLEATINRIVGNYNYFNNCENTVVLYYVSIEK